MSCDVCTAGERRPQLIRYSLSMADRLILVDHVPAEVCDRCGEVTLSPDVVERLPPELTCLEFGSPNATLFITGAENSAGVIVYAEARRSPALRKELSVSFQRVRHQCSDMPGFENVTPRMNRFPTDWNRGGKVPRCTRDPDVRGRERWIGGEAA